MEYKYFFYKNKQNEEIQLAFKHKLEKSYKSCLFIPVLFEKQKSSQIQNYQFYLNLKFLFFGLSHKSLLNSVDPYDYQIVKSRAYNLMFHVLGFGALMFIANRIATFYSNNLFFEFIASSKLIKRRPKLKTPFMLLIFCFGVNSLFKKVRNDKFMFLTALKYKEFIVPGKLISPNCELEFQIIQKNIPKNNVG